MGGSGEQPGRTAALEGQPVHVRRAPMPAAGNGGKEDGVWVSSETVKMWEKLMGEIAAFQREAHPVQRALSQRDLYEILSPHLAKHMTFETFKRLLHRMPMKEETVQAHARRLRKALRKAQARMHEERIIYEYNARKLGRQVKRMIKQFKPYRGVYRTFRLSRRGELVSGVLVLDCHPEARIPYHWHKHRQASQAGEAASWAFRYGGHVYMGDRNFCLQGWGMGEFRNIKVMNGHVLDGMLWGHLQTETAFSRQPFHSHVIFIRREHLRDNPPNREELVRLLREGLPG